MFKQDLHDALFRVAPKALDRQHNPLLDPYGEQWIEKLVFAMALFRAHQRPDDDDTRLIENAFRQYEQQGKLSFDDDETAEALAVRKMLDKMTADKQARHQRYLESKNTLRLTDEQKAKIASPDFKFTRMGRLLRMMLKYIHPTEEFCYDDFGIGLDSNIKNCQVVNSWIRNGLVEVVKYHPSPWQVRLRTGPNYERAVKQFGIKDVRRWEPTRKAR